MTSETCVVNLECLFTYFPMAKRIEFYKILNVYKLDILIYIEETELPSTVIAQGVIIGNIYILIYSNKEFLEYNKK